MRNPALRIATAIAVTAASLGIAAATASASEKTYGDVPPPQVAASVDSQDVTRGEQNTRVGNHGKVQAGFSQLAELPNGKAYGK